MLVFGISHITLVLSFGFSLLPNVLTADQHLSRLARCDNLAQGCSEASNAGIVSNVIIHQQSSPKQQEVSVRSPDKSKHKLERRGFFGKHRGKTQGPAGANQQEHQLTDFELRIQALPPEVRRRIAIKQAIGHNSGINIWEKLKDVDRKANHMYRDHTSALSDRRRNDRRLHQEIPEDLGHEAKRKWLQFHLNDALWMMTDRYADRYRSQLSQAKMTKNELRQAAKAVATREGLWTSTLRFGNIVHGYDYGREWDMRERQKWQMGQKKGKHVANVVADFSRIHHGRPLTPEQYIFLKDRTIHPK